MKTMKMQRLIISGIILCALLVGFWPQSLAARPVAEALNYKIVGYMPSWAGLVSEMQFTKLTHVNYAFVIPNGDGSLGPVDNPSKLQSVVSSAHANGVKVLISIGGWNNGNDSGFETLAASSTGRTNFTNNIVNLVNQYGLDGVDIDWEYPDPDNANPDNPQPGSSAHNYGLMMSSLASAMHSRGKLLTAAVVSLGFTGKGVPTSTFNDVDFLNLMAYDGGDGAAHSPYQLAVDSVNFWRGRGLPATKTVLGVPFYGRPTWASYRTLIAAGCSPDSDTCNYQGSLVYYNGRPTMNQKSDLAIAQGGGIMYWEDSQDTKDSTSLHTTIYNRLNGGPPPATPTKTNTATGPTNTPTRTATTPPGGNLALNKPATASSVESGTSFTANLAVDGNTGTRWSSAASDPQWIRVDLGSTTSISRVVLRWEAAYGKSYQIQTSNDDVNWTTIYSTTTGDGGVDDLTGLSGSGRYVRMYGTVRGTAWGYSLWELEVYGTGGPTATPTPTRTNTPVGPTNTPTNTSVGPTPTRTNTPVGPTPTRTNTPTSGAQPWDGNNHPYAVNDLVTYLGNTYKCIQAHTSLPTWDPVSAPALWQLQ